MNNVFRGLLTVVFVGSFHVVFVSAMEESSVSHSTDIKPLVIGGSGSDSSSSGESEESDYGDCELFEDAWREELSQYRRGGNSQKNHHRRMGLEGIEGFYGDHAQEIQTAEQVIDNLLGNKDGKLTPDEVIGILKKVSKGLLKVKNLIVGIFKKKESSSSVSSDVQRRIFPISSAHVKLPKALGIKTLKEKLGVRLHDAKALLADVAHKLKELKDAAFAPIKGFIVEHEQLISMIDELAEHLDKETDDVRGGFFEVGKLGEVIDVVVDKIGKIERSFFVDVHVFETIIDEVPANSSLLNECDIELMPLPEASIRGFAAPAEQALAFFECLVKYEQPDHKLSFKQIPSVIAALKARIEKLKNLIAKAHMPRRANRALDKAFIELMRNDVKAIGMGLIHLKQIAQSISGKSIPKIDIQKIHELIEAGCQDGDDPAIKEQLEKYVELIGAGDTRKIGMPINLQTLGESLDATLKFVQKLEGMIAAADEFAAQQGSSSLVSSMARNFDWAKWGSYVAVAVVTLNSIIEIGGRIGAWNLV